jgi:hypothetical protein
VALLADDVWKSQCLEELDEIVTFGRSEGAAANSRLAWTECGAGCASVSPWCGLVVPYR